MGLGNGLCRTDTPIHEWLYVGVWVGVGNGLMYAGDLVGVLMWLGRDCASDELCFSHSSKNTPFSRYAVR